MWQPPISPKQADVLNDAKRFPLVTGPRNSSKSFGILHSIPWRMWNTQNYVGCMIGCTTSQNSDSGLFTLLTQTVMPLWIAADFGFDWVMQPKMEMLTHRLHFSCTNKFGGESFYYLDSLKVESEVWEKYRGKFFTDIFLTESDNFKSRRTFDCLRECLRTPGVPPEQHRIIFDTNPPAESEDHWLFKLFFWFRTLDLQALNDEEKAELNISGFSGADYDDALLGLKELQDQLSVHSFQVSDNVFISAAQRRAQFAAYAHDKDLLDRMYYGRWTRSTSDGIFSETFRSNIHIVGEPPTPSNPDPDVLLPEDGCFEMLGSWDIGNRRNTAAYIIEPVPVEVEEHGEMVPKLGFKYLKEFVSLGKQQDLGVTCDDMLEKVEYVEDLAGKPLIWRHWSDSSSFDISGQTQTSEATDIYRMSNGKIELRSIVAPFVGMKGQGSVERRISLMQRLLFEQRIWICPVGCPHLIQMFRSIKRGANSKLSASSIWKHTLDAASYGPAVECWFEMRRTSPKLRSSKEDNGLIVTRL